MDRPNDRTAAVLVRIRLSNLSLLRFLPMQWLRGHTKTILWIVILAFLVTVFLVWGMQRSAFRQQDERTSIAVVNDVSISVNDFYERWNNKVADLRMELGSAFTEEMADSFKSRVLKSMITDEILTQEAKKQGIFVTREEIKNSIMGSSTFRDENGGFNQARFQQALEDPSVNWPAIEASEAHSLLLMKLANSIGESVRITDEEAKQKFLRLHRQAKLLLAVFEPKAYASKVRVYEREIAEAYAKNRSDYEKPESVKVSHILVEVKENATTAEEAKAKDKIEGLLKKIKAGAKFADLAKTESDDPGSAQQGGSLGEITRGMMVPEFEKAAFALKKGELSPIVRTKFGYHIILCEGHKEAQTTSLAKVKDKLRNTIVEAKAMVLAGLMADSFSNDSPQPKDWEALAKKYGGRAVRTGWWRKGDTLPDFGKVDNLAGRVLNQFKDEKGNPVSEDKRFFVGIITDEKMPAFDAKAYDKVRDDVYDQALREKQQRVFDAWQENLENTSKVENHLSDLQKNRSL